MNWKTVASCWWFIWIKCKTPVPKKLNEVPLARNTDCRFGRTEMLRFARSAVECWKVGARFEEWPLIQTRTNVFMIQNVDLSVMIRFTFVRRPVQIPSGSTILTDFSHLSWCLQAINGVVPRLGDGRFLPDPPKSSFPTFYAVSLPTLKVP
jgi:hypothetical protein